MNAALFIVLVVLTFCNASVILEEEEIIAEPEEDIYDVDARTEKERECLQLEEECTSRLEGCCKQGFSNITCECYRMMKIISEDKFEDTKRNRCWCERTGKWYEKGLDWISDKMGK